MDHVNATTQATRTRRPRLSEIRKSASPELAAIIEAHAAARAEASAAREAWRPFIEAVKNAERANRPTEDQQRAARDSVAVPEILRVPHTKPQMVRCDIIFSDGEVRSSEFPPENTWALTGYDSIEKHFADEPERLQEAQKAWEVWQSKRFQAVRALRSEEERTAQREADRVMGGVLKAEDNARRAHMALVKYLPTTASDRIVHALACIEALGGKVRADGRVTPPDLDGDEPDMKSLFNLLVGTLLDMAPPPHPDATLLKVGEKFEASWAEQRAYNINDGDDGYDRLHARTSSIGAVIMGMPATTLEGLQVKARVVQECQTDDPTAPVEFTTADYICDTRAAQIIVNDLLGLKERPADERRADAEMNAQALQRDRLRGMRAMVESAIYDA